MKKSEVSFNAAKTAHVYWVSEAMRSPTKLCESRQDFGRDETRGLRLRRLGPDYDAMEAGVIDMLILGDVGRLEDDAIGVDDPSFGCFLGWHSCGWCVGLFTAGSINNFVGLEEFDTLEELKEEWELD